MAKCSKILHNRRTQKMEAWDAGQNAQKVQRALCSEGASTNCARTKEKSLHRKPVGSSLTDRGVTHGRISTCPYNTVLHHTRQHLLLLLGLLAIVEPGEEATDEHERLVPLRRLPRSGFTERQRLPNRVCGAEDAAEPARVANGALHHVPDGVFGYEPVLGELERARLRRRRKALARGLVAQEAGAIIRAGGLRREPDPPGVERVGAEMMEARIQIRECLLDVEAAHGLEVIRLRKAVGAADEWAHEAEGFGQQLGLLDALAVEEKLFGLLDERRPM